MERSKTITDLRKEGTLPTELEDNFPRITSTIRSMTSCVPSKRPTTSELLEQHFSKEAKERMELESKVERLQRLVESQRRIIEEQRATIRHLSEKKQSEENNL